MFRRDVILFGILALFLTALAFVMPGSALNSNSGNFTLTPNATYLNWTNMNINMTSKNTNVILAIGNASTAVTPQYFVAGYYLVDNQDSVYPNLSSAENGQCFTQSGLSGMKFYVQNTSSGAYTNTTDTLANGTSTLYTLSAYQFCPPGYYFGLFNVTQNGASDWANVSMSVIIPISSYNTFNETASKGGFKGSFASAATTYQSYYFNTSQAQNTTGVTINLTWADYSQDLDLFVFNSAGTLQGKSIEKAASEAVAYLPLPSTPDMWEIRIFGNLSSQVDYTGWLYFTTLNVTNTSNQNQMITSLDFGSVNPNATSGEINYTLNNIDTTAWNDVNETKELYRVDSWLSQSQAGTFNLLVPYFAQKVRVKVQWTGATRWNFTLNDSNGNVIGNSTNKYYSASVTNATQEEFIEFTGPFNTTNDGLWKIIAVNNTAITSYNVTAYVWIPGSALVSNYPTATGFNLGAYGSANSTKNVSVYVSAPENDITNGTYQGFIEYYKANEWKLRLPVYFQVRAATLLVNNTLESTSVTLNDNVGFNRVGASALVVVLPITNLGYYNISFTNVTSDYKLNNTGDTANYMTFSVNWSQNPIVAGQNDTMNITIYINTSFTKESAGFYSGSITLNTTNATVTSSSYPFKTFTIFLNVNLTGANNGLTVNVTGITPLTVNTPQNITNITANISVKLANGTTISLYNVMQIYDFTSTYIKEENISYQPDPNLQNRTGGGTGGAVCPSGDAFGLCYVKSSLPAGFPGGTYHFYAVAQFNTTVLGGTGMNLSGTSAAAASTLSVNDTGIYLNTEDSGHDAGTVYETKKTSYTIIVRNYGPLSASGLKIRFEENGCDSLISDVAENSTFTNCSTGVSKSYNTTYDYYTVDGLDGNNAETCTLAWTLTAAVVDEDDGCNNAMIVVYSAHNNFGNFTDIALTVYDNGTIINTEDQGGNQQSSTCSTNASCSDTQYCKSGSCISVSCPSGQYAKSHVCNKYGPRINITDYTTEKIYVLQGGSNSTKVTAKNTGGYSYTAKLEANSTVAGFNASITPTSYTLSPGNSGIFTVDFGVPASAEIGYYAMTVKAYASDNASVYDTKDITIGVEPLEQTKEQVNQTYDNIKTLFASVATLFNQLAPKTDDANYTLANRTYYRLLNMLQDIENNIKLGNYLEARSLMDEANSSITTFRQQVEQLSAAGGLLSFLGGSNILTLVAILVVVIVIGGFLAYLLLPPKKGYHPVTGYLPKEKISVTHKLAYFFTHIRLRKPKTPGSQRTLQTYERSVPAAPAPAPVQPGRRYAEGYHRLDEFPLSYDKNKLKEKK